MWHAFIYTALCSPACSLTTDTCVALNTCQCGSTGEVCGSNTLSNRCLNSVCVCGTSSTCTTGTTIAVCLDQIGQTPGSTNSVATCKVKFKIRGSRCRLTLYPSYPISNERSEILLCFSVAVIPCAVQLPEQTQVNLFVVQLQVRWVPML